MKSIFYVFFSVDRCLKNGDFSLDPLVFNIFYKTRKSRRLSGFKSKSKPAIADVKTDLKKDLTKNVVFRVL